MNKQKRAKTLFSIMLICGLLLFITSKEIDENIREVVLLSSLAISVIVFFAKNKIYHWYTIF